MAKKVAGSARETDRVRAAVSEPAVKQVPGAKRVKRATAARRTTPTPTPTPTPRATSQSRASRSATAGVAVTARTAGANRATIVDVSEWLCGAPARIAHDLRYDDPGRLTRELEEAGRGGPAHMIETTFRSMIRFAMDHVIRLHVRASTALRNASDYDGSTYGDSMSFGRSAEVLSNVERAQDRAAAMFLKYASCMRMLREPARPGHGHGRAEPADDHAEAEPLREAEPNLPAVSSAPPPPPGVAATTPQIGDLVQWESAGVAQFPSPLRVVGKSEDGAFVFVEGSGTGLPVEEVRVSDSALSADPRGASAKSATESA